VKYATGADFRAALEDRLRRTASERGQPVARLRKSVVFDRLLARLAVVAPGAWVLKGGFALDLRRDLRARLTKDVDLDLAVDEEVARRHLQAAATLELGDFFEFQVERDREGENIAPGGGEVRYRAKANLGGREFDTVKVDLGFSDPLTVNPEQLRGPDLLAFANLEPATVPAVRLEQHVAEKVHAYTRRYGEDQPSSRAKDLIDLLLIAEMADFEYSHLREALERTFESRGTHSLPSTLPRPDEAWMRSFAKLAHEVELDPDLNAAHEAARVFLDPVLRARGSGVWSRSRKKWAD
jgi:predicted nucleotidyltransferase component of viral defense system